MKELGVLAPIVTPCDTNGRVDIEGLRSVCKYVKDGGCRSIFACGSTGRGPWFSHADRQRICRTVAESAGDTPVFAGCIASGLP